MNKRLYKTGFTLIEILVVISIIGILSGVLYASFGDARNDSRNKVLQTELKEVQLALELYKSQNGEYPAAGVGGGTCNAGTTLAVDKANSDGCVGIAIITGLAPDFIAELLSDTSSGNPNCNIVYAVDGTDHSWYKLTAEHCVANVVAATGVQSGDELARCLSNCPVASGCTAAYRITAPFYESYAIYSNGGECQL